MKSFGGPVLILDRSDINTDEIIPAKYLTEVSKEALKAHCLEDLRLDGFSNASAAFTSARVVITRENFGCGSSREHAPWALEVNGITVVIAESYARIFRQNMFNCGMLAIELPRETIDDIMGFCGAYANSTCSVDWNGQALTFTGNTKSLIIPFVLNQFDHALVVSGGWVEFADANY